MNLLRRGFLHLLASAALWPAATDFAVAQSYPTRPVRIMVLHERGEVTTLDVQRDRLHTA
jgi:hypothetical protein